MFIVKINNKTIRWSREKNKLITLSANLVIDYGQTRWIVVWYVTIFRRYVLKPFCRTFADWFPNNEGTNRISEDILMLHEFLPDWSQESIYTLNHRFCCFKKQSKMDYIKV
jgi:hypothetical protein